jgi:hypothetical protein
LASEFTAHSCWLSSKDDFHWNNAAICQILTPESF